MVFGAVSQTNHGEYQTIANIFNLPNKALGHIHVRHTMHS